MGIYSHNYGSWDMPSQVVYKLENQESNGIIHFKFENPRLVVPMSKDRRRWTS